MNWLEVIRIIGTCWKCLGYVNLYKKIKINVKYDLIMTNLIWIF